MGSFYSTCSVSHMTLTNQKTSIQLLVPNNKSLKEHKSMIVSNDGAQEFYSPFGFPIHGRYDDYGHLQNIKEDGNTKMLEDFFNMSIYNIIENIGRKRDVPENAKNIDFYNSLSMTYFRTEFLEHLQKGWENIDLVNPKQYTGDEMLSKFFNHYFRDKSNENGRLEYLESLDRELTEEESKEFISIIRNTHNEPRNYVTCNKSNSMFSVLPIDISFKEDILKQYQFLIMYGWALNRVLLPSMYGSQQDNYLHIYNLNELVNELLLEDIKDNLDDGYYEDEDEIEAESILKRYQRNKNLRELGV
jgi:hypothetical protein